MSCHSANLALVTALELGISGRATMTVSLEETAVVQGTGDVEVLSTPRLLQLMQEATMDALAGRLPEGVITAGLRINLDHLHGSVVGDTIEAVAVLTRIEGRRLIFEAEATGGGQIVGSGRIIRVQIGRDQFLRRLE